MTRDTLVERACGSKSADESHRARLRGEMGRLRRVLRGGGSCLGLAVLSGVGGLTAAPTGGWGLNGYFFTLPWVWEAGAGVALVFWFTAAMLVFVSGFWAATIYKRSGSLMLTLVLVGLGALLVLWMYLVGRLDAWAQVFEWFAAQGPFGLSLWGLLLGAVLAAVAFLTLRRAVP